MLRRANVDVPLPPNNTLRGLVEKIKARRLAPAAVLIHFNAVREYGNLGSHDQEPEDIQTVQAAGIDYIKPCLAALDAIYSWYYSEFLDCTLDGAMVEASGLIDLTRLDIHGVDVADSAVANRKVGAARDGLQPAERAVAAHVPKDSPSTPAGPPPLRSRVAKAESLVRRGDVRGALQELAEIALVLAANGANAPLARVLERMLYLDPRNIDIRVQLAELYLSSLDDPQRAQRHIVLALRIDPRNTTALSLMVVACRRRGEEERAKSALKVIDAVRWSRRRT